MKNKNVRWVNIAKGLGIITVVIGHSGSPLRNYLYLFHMALFFFLSGYLYKDHYTNNFLQFIKKRVVSLYLPFVKYQIIFILLRNVFFSLNIYNTKVLVSGAQMQPIGDKGTFITLIKAIVTFNGTDPLLGTFWFIQVLFFINIIFFAISKILNIFRLKKEYFRFIFVSILFSVGFVIIYSNFNFSRFNPNNKLTIEMILKLFQPQVLIVTAIYYLGYLFKKYEESISMNKVVALITIIILYISSYFGRIEISSNIYTSPIFFLLTSVCGIYMITYISKMINIRFKANILDYIGKNSFTVMALHLIAFKIVSLVQVIIYKDNFNKVASYPTYYSNGIWWIIYTIIGLAVPIILKYLYDKVTYIIITSLRKKEVIAN